MTNLVRTAFAKTIREKRISLNLSIEKVSKMIGMSDGMYVSIETANYAPSLQVLFDLYEILGFELSDVKERVNQLAKAKQ